MPGFLVAYVHWVERFNRGIGKVGALAPRCPGRDRQTMKRTRFERVHRGSDKACRAT